MLQLEIRNAITFSIYLARIVHDVVQEISYFQFTETYHTHRTNCQTEKEWPKTE